MENKTKSTALGAGAAVGILALAGVGVVSLTQLSNGAMDSDSQSEWVEENAPAAPAEPPEPSITTLSEGDTHTVTDNMYGESFSFTIEDVRYLPEIEMNDNTDPEVGYYGTTLTAFDGEGLFAVVDMTYTNDEGQPQEFMYVFDSYVNSSGSTVPNDDAVTSSNPDSFAILIPEDIGAEALLDEAQIQAGTSIQASEFHAVPEDSGYLYGADGTYRLELPPNE